MRRLRRLVHDRELRSPRGVSLLESMVAGVVLVTALLGGLQAIIHASKQNSYANRMVKASAVAQDCRQALQALGRDTVVNILLAPGNCADLSDASAGIGEIASKLHLAAVANPCVIDLDASSFEGLFPSYPDENARLFSRLLVVVERENDVDTLGVVVAWNENGVPRVHQQLFALYNPAANAAIADL